MFRREERRRADGSCSGCGRCRIRCKGQRDGGVCGNPFSTLSSDRAADASVGQLPGLSGWHDRDGTGLHTGSPPSADAGIRDAVSAACGIGAGDLVWAGAGGKLLRPEQRRKAGPLRAQGGRHDDALCRAAGVREPERCTLCKNNGCVWTRDSFFRRPHGFQRTSLHAGADRGSETPV